MTGGKVTASGSSQTITPAVVKAGQVSYGYVYFQSGAVPASSTFQFTVTSNTPDSSNPFESIDLQVTQANEVAGGPGQNGPTITGSFTNPSSKTISLPSVEVYCFDAAGTQLLRQADGDAGNGNVPPHATGSFTASVYDATCPTFMVGATARPAN